MAKMKWIDWLKSRGINPDDEMPDNDLPPINGEQVQEQESEQDNGTGDAFLKRIDDLQKEIISLKEANKNLALRGNVEKNTKTIEQEIDDILKEC